MLLLSFVLVVCSGVAQVLVAGRGNPGPPQLLGPKNPAEAASRCCGPSDALPPKPPLEHPGPERCCGKGWGLHCCIGAGCCLGDAVVAVAQQGLPQQGLPWPSRPAPRPAPRALHESNPWWKDWVQWVNLGVLLAVVAIVGGVLSCCWHRWCRGRPDDAFRLRQQLLLRDPKSSGLYAYGATGPSPSAPHWQTPVASRWVDFYKPPPNNPTSPLYRQGPMVRAPAPESDTDVPVSPVFSSSDEEYRLVVEFKRKTKWPD